MAGFFNLPSAKSTLKKDMNLAKKSKQAKTSNTITIKGGGSLMDKIQSIVTLVNSKFANKKDTFLLLRNEEEFISYMDKCIENGVISIDTETTGLDPIENHIVGMCIYTPGMKAAYVPVAHISYITQAPIDNQLSKEFIKEQLQRLVDAEVKTIWFNAPFDVRFIKHSIGIQLPIYWDASIGARILNSNEPRGARGLKALHKRYCRHNEGEAFSFDKLFEGIPFDLIPVTTAYLYAANDAIITYELYEFQKYYLDPECEGYTKYNMEGPSYVFFNIEMASMPVFIEMEENGVEIDVEYAKTISAKYHEMSDKTKKRCDDVLKQYAEEIDAYRRATPGCKLTDPVNLDSPVQLAILLYDVFKIPVVDKRNPRGTGADILEQIDHPIVAAILDNRFFNKQLSTYVDKIPELIHADGRVHCKFNQYGADCVIGSSLLLTNKGYCRIDSLFTGQEENGKFYDCNETIYNINLQQEQTSAKIAFYDTPTIKLTLRGGYTIEGTPNHPIVCSQLTKDDIQRNKSNRQLRRLTETQTFCKLEDIKIGDIVAIPYGYNIFPTEYVSIDLELQNHRFMKPEYKFPTILNEEFAEFLGMYFADGSWDSNAGTFRVAITNKNKEVIDRFKYLANSLFGVCCINEPEKHSTTTSFSSLAHKNLIKYLDKGARNKRIHCDIMNSPKSVVCAFIKGMTLDSSINVERQEFELNCVDKVSNAFVKQVLTNIGILTGVKRDYYFEGKDHCGNDVPRMQVERICIKGEMYKKFLDEIGVIESKKYINPESFLKTEYLCNNNYYYAYVTKIEQRTNDVYDLTVPETHSFICEGFINHNTGRVSSDSPNLQNIPSNPRKLTTGEKVDAGHDIRQFFSAPKGKVLLSCDYSGQEVRVTAHVSHDQKMIQAYVDNKDVYVEIASLSYGVPYEECLEHRPDGTTNPEGKARRGSAKKIVLGILYGRQVASIAQQLGVSTKEAQAIYDKVLDSFPELAQFIQDAQEQARKYGYVSTIWGRRRQLPDMQLPLYEFTYTDGVPMDFDPLADDEVEISTEVPLELCEKWTNELLNCRYYKSKLALLDKIRAQGISIKDNSMKVTDAERQCVNSIVQGSSADLTKLAMIELYNNSELRELGFKMLIPVHDEIIAECPVENSARCAELMSECMKHAGKDLCVPLKCDVEAFYHWYGESLDPVTLQPLGN